MVRVHPGSLIHGLQVLRRHASVVGRKFGFDSRADLCGTIAPLAARRPRAQLGTHVPRRGEIPLQGICGGFDSLRLHWHRGSWSKGKIPARQTGDPGSNPGGSTRTEGSRLPACRAALERRFSPWARGGFDSLAFRFGLAGRAPAAGSCHPDGEKDHHASLRTRRFRFKS